MRNARMALALFALGCAAEPSRPPLSAAEPPPPPPVARPAPVMKAFRVAVVSDLNGSYGSCRYNEAVHAAVDRIVGLRPDLVLSTGDMVAGQRRGVDHPRMWRSFHAAVSDRLAEASIPFAVTPGNHDASGYYRWVEERSLFVREWRARTPDVEMVDGSSYPLRYSFVAGPAFFVSLDATVVGGLDDDQMGWLEAQLAEAPREVTVVFGHLPLYPFAEGRARETLGDPRLEAMLRRHDVDLFVSGHHHAYYPGRRGPLRLVSTACLGAGPRPLLGQALASERSLLVFEIGEAGIEQLDAWGGASFDRAIERASLPESVGNGERRIDRDDLVSDPSSS